MTGFPIKEALKYFVVLPENISYVFMDNHSPDSGTVIDITAGALAGVFFAWFFPQAFLHVAQVNPKNGRTPTTSVILMGINLGAAFAAPMVNGLYGAIGLTSSAGVLSFCGFGFAALAILEYIYNFFDKKKQA